MNSISLAVAALLMSAAPPQGDDAFWKYARTVEHGISQGRGNALFMDVEALVRRVTADIPAPDQFRAGFIRGMKKSGGDRKLGEQLAQTVRKGGSLQLLRVHSVNGQSHALYRLLSDKGVNYLDLHLDRPNSGKVRVTDCYVYLSGETMGETLRRIFLLAASEAKLGVLDRLMGKEQDFLRNAGKLKEMQSLYQENKHAEAIAIFEKLPASLKKEKVFLLLRFNAAAALGDDAQYRRAVEDYEAAVPGDPSLDLMSIDGHFLRKQYDQALARVDSLDKRVNDPYLEYFRGSIYFVKGDQESAKRHFRAGIQADPTLPHPYWGIITVALKEKDFKVVAETLTAVRKNAGIKLADLEQLPDYSEFVQSKEYRSWKNTKR